MQGGRAVLQNGNRSTVIAKDRINILADATARHFATFIDAIRKGGPLPPGNVRDARNTLALVFAAYPRAVSGKAIEMGEYANSRTVAKRL